MRLNIRRTLQLTSGFLTVGAVAVLSAQQPKTLSSSDSSRPLSQMITQLRKTEGIPICYEDPRYRNSEDLQDVTEPVSRGTTLEKQFGPRIVVPNSPWCK